MTRESKLALIIGFVLILVVGVLVSDHLSQATLDTIDPNSGLELQQHPIAQLPTTRDQSRLENTITRATPETQGRAHQITNDPIVISQATPREPSLLDQARQAMNGLGTTNPPSLAAQDSRKLPSTTEKRYTVRPNDSLYAIARRVLGDGDRYVEIHHLNMKLLGPDPVLQPGMVLVLPGNAIVTDGQRTQSQRDPSSNTNNARTTSYTVVSGDVLSMISQRLLGTSKRADEIAKLNGLNDADDIRVGMVLKIPAQ